VNTTTSQPKLAVRISSRAEKIQRESAARYTRRKPRLSATMPQPRLATLWASTKAPVSTPSLVPPISMWVWA
jgi:hypothetical protein